MEIKILYLYYDLMNLYGDNGNVRCLFKNLSMQPELSVTVYKKSICDEIDFSDYDFLYIGSGTEKNQKVALSHLLKYKDELKKFIEDEKIALLTGNSIEMLGSSIVNKNGEKYEGLSIFDFNTVEENRRDNLDVIANCELFESEVVGFINKSSQINGDITPLFTVTRGIGNNKDTKGEGYFYKNLFATHLIGPITIKNPHFGLFVMSKILKKTPIDTFSDSSKEAFKVSLEALK
ncbi:MAG: glutamine amidotransferase [Oscillospiraceae bacterium]